MRRECIESKDKRYRYVLKISWRLTLPQAVFVMLNPSTADKNRDDPTSLKCITLADRWKCGGVSLVNLFAYRATDPQELRLQTIPIVGFFNDQHVLTQCCANRKHVVCAWGNHGTYLGRDREVIALLRQARVRLQCLGINDNGTPEHPLLVPHARVLIPFPYN
jgi:hypothetical protein